MNALHVIPPDATQATHFDCEWGPWPTCSLAYRACLARQSAMRRAPGRGHRKSPMYPTCHDECAVGRTVAARFGAAGATVHSPTAFGVMQIYRPASPAKEKEMARGKRSEPCPGCGSEGTRHRSGCEVGGKVSASARRGRAPFDPALLSDDDLLACIREACDRRDRLRRELEERAKRLGTALAQAALPPAMRDETAKAADRAAVG